MTYPHPPAPGRGRAIGLAAVVVAVAAALGGLVTAGVGDRHVAGRASPAGPARTGSQPPPPPEAAQPGWETLTNPAAGLSYQIPPTGWTVKARNGTAGSIALGQGADLSAYLCGTPQEQLLRGALGSGSAPPGDPAALARSVAYAAASQYYLNGASPPQVRVDPAQAVRRTGPGGRAVTGALVKSVATQRIDPCLASAGEVLVLVLRFADHDGVLVVNGDLAGGPANPPPSTDEDLRRIIGTARATA